MQKSLIAGAFTLACVNAVSESVSAIQEELIKATAQEKFDSLETKTDPTTEEPTEKKQESNAALPACPNGLDGLPTDQLVTSLPYWDTT